MPNRKFLVDLLRGYSASMGYKLDFLQIPAADHQVQMETARMMRRRGIRGLIFLPSTPAAETFSIPWEYFASVRLFRPPREIRITSVDADSFQGMNLLVRQFVALGYERPGLAMPSLVARYTENEWQWQLKTFGSESERFRPVASFEFSAGLESESERERLLAWVLTARPDIILAFEAPAVARALRDFGSRLPQPVALFDLDREDHLPSGEALAGLRRSRQAICRTAVDHLHSLLMTNSLGLPEYPVTIRVGYQWADGPTRPAKPPVKSDRVTTAAMES